MHRVVLSLMKENDIVQCIDTLFCTIRYYCILSDVLCLCSMEEKRYVAALYKRAVVIVECCCQDLLFW